MLYYYQIVNKNIQIKNMESQLTGDFIFGINRTVDNDISATFLVFNGSQNSTTLMREMERYPNYRFANETELGAFIRFVNWGYKPGVFGRSRYRLIAYDEIDGKFAKYTEAPDFGPLEKWEKGFVFDDYFVFLLIRK